MTEKPLVQLVVEASQLGWAPGFFPKSHNFDGITLYRWAEHWNQQGLVSISYAYENMCVDVLND